MAKICLCLTANTLSENLEILDKFRKYVDMAELRVDCLEADERLHIRSFPDMAGLPLILSIRRDIDGGSYTGGEGSRITLFAMGLAFADADRRRNFAYVDLEEDLHVPSLEEAARTYGTRIIRSWYNTEGIDDDLAVKLRKLKRIGDELAKASMMPKSINDVAKVYRHAKECGDIEKIIQCRGEFGLNTVILAERLGSQISYVYPEDRGKSAGEFQVNPRELTENYRFREVRKDTKIFAVSGYPLKNFDSVLFFNKVFNIEQIDAVYIPIPSDSVHSLMRLAEETGISGMSITAPHNEDILPYLSSLSSEVDLIGACNTVLSGQQGWHGCNTDAASFSDSFLDFYHHRDLRRQRVTIIGAGGTARAIAAEVYRLKGKALILNRNNARARRLAEPYKFAWAGLDSRGAELMDKYSDIIIQTSPVGSYPNINEDPIDFYEFSGMETVMDINYKPEKTLFLKRAEAAGCRILNGYDMLSRQARYQYKHFMGREFPPSLISRLGL